MPGEIALIILEKYLLRGSFLVKLQASSLMSRKITKIMHEWSIVINLFWWLTIQTTLKIDQIPCNCVYIFKTFSMQYLLDYYVERKNVRPLQKQIECSVSAENAFCNIFLPPLRTDETVMCALTEYNWYFENLAYCLFNIPELKDSIFLDTKLIFVYYIAIFVQALGFFSSFSCFVAKLISS